MTSYFTDEEQWLKEWGRRVKNAGNLVWCSRCLYNEETPNILFNSDGVCNYCEKDHLLRQQFPGGSQGEEAFRNIVEEIKKEGRGKKYDVIVGVSGGADSTNLLHIAKEYGLRPLAVHFDNTWNTTVAQENIKNALAVLDVDLWTYVVNNAEYDDIYRAFLKASTPDLEIPTDIALAAVLNIASQKFGVRYIFEGHSFRTEGMAPVGWIYMDAKYIQSVHKKYGTAPVKTFPNFSITRQLKWMLLNRIKKIRPLWYLDYDKESVKTMLAEKYQWQWYGGHHLENRMTAFYHTYYLPRKFDIDMRALGYSALVRSGQMLREDGLRLLKEAPKFDSNLFDMILKRLGYQLNEFECLMLLPHSTYKDFKTYKSLFERMRPFFYLMAKAELIPWSFYHKYTLKNNI